MTNKEMDALIAERVMGWHRGPSFKGRSEWWYNGEEFEISVREWHPMTDEAQALRALEVMCDKGYEARLGKSGREWWAWLSKYDEGSTFFDPLFSVAVCLALAEAVKE